MTNEQFKSLRRGDIILGKLSGNSYVVDSVYDDFAIAVRTAHISNPDEWVLCESDKADNP